MNFKTLIYLPVIAILLFNCSSGNDDTPPDPAPTTVTYNSAIKSIMSNNCNSCHGTPTSNGAPVSFTTYNQVKSAVNNIITRTNSTSNPMPPIGGLISQANRNLIQKWKDDGLLEN